MFGQRGSEAAGPVKEIGFLEEGEEEEKENRTRLVGRFR